MMLEKSCSACGISKPADQFHKCKTSKDGLKSSCKKCSIERVKEYYKKNRDKVLAYHKEHYKKNSDEIKANVTRYRKENPGKIRARDKSYRMRNRDRLKIKEAEYYQKHKERFREYSRARYIRMRDKIIEKVRLFRINNKIKRWQWQHNRRARTKQGGSHTQGQWASILKHYAPGGECLSCKEKNVKISMDHVVPLSKGGKNTADNLQPLCRTCNSRKGTRTLDYRPDKGAFARSLL